ncbi:hypothetical protein JVU11DRAFT_2854 [Chiua virens]|nr:hypothetical protein JVU11DRAFT_2854 [Chiua virens]
MRVKLSYSTCARYASALRRATAIEWIVALDSTGVKFSSKAFNFTPPLRKQALLWTGQWPQNRAQDHRCLAIVEVQRAIFHEVHKATLARLARTCQTFSNTALDILWENLASIMNLVRCLPEDIWEVSNYGHRKTTFKRAMTRRDWEILSGYSSRIRSLSALKTANST